MRLFKNFSYFGDSIIYLSFFLMIIFPTSFQNIRAIFLLIIGLVTLSNFKKLNPKLSGKIFLFTTICFTNTFISILIGLINDNPGLIPILRTTFIWPLFFTWLISCNNSLERLDRLQKIIEIGFIVNLILLIIMILIQYINV